MRRVSFALLVSTVLMAPAPAASFAQALPSDPEADSPSGVVYELPVDRARRDAAPRRGTREGRDGGSDSPGSTGGGGTSGSGGGTSSSPSGGSGAGGAAPETSIRSENNFGTSSEVPGAPSKRKRSRAGRGASGSEAGDRDGGGSGANAVKRVAAASTGATDGPSDGVVYPLLAALLAVGAGIGAFAGHRSFRKRRSD